MQAVIELELEVVAGPNAGRVGDVTLVGQSDDEGAGGGPLMLRRDVQYCKKEQQTTSDRNPSTHKQTPRHLPFKSFYLTPLANVSWKCS